MIFTTDAFADAPITVMVLTSARPIIRAAEVDAVRRGLRRAFSRLSVPAVPNQPRERRREDLDHRPAQQRAQRGHAEEHADRSEADQCRG